MSVVLATKGIIGVSGNSGDTAVPVCKPKIVSIEDLEPKLVTSDED